MDAILDFRACFEAVSASLAPYVAWWDCVRQNALRIESLLPLRDSEKNYERRRMEDLASGLAGQRFSAPEYTYVPIHHSGDIVELDWVCRLANQSPEDEPYFVRADYGQPVYLATLKRLRAWIAKEEGWTLRDFDARVTSFDPVQSRKEPTRFLAFLALRYWSESQFAVDCKRPLGAREGAQLSMIRFKNVPRYRYRTARLEWRAIFLAQYASWHLRLLKAPHCSLRAILQEAGGYREQILIRSQLFELQRCDTNLYARPPAYTAWFEGEVVFRSVRGMPLWPWSRRSRGQPSTDTDGTTRLFPSRTLGSAIALDLLTHCACRQDGVSDWFPASDPA